jgi:hypothetical protein
MIIQLSEHCEFYNFLNEALRDRLVCGLLSDSIRRKLLMEKSLTFEDASSIALNMELAENQS